MDRVYLTIILSLVATFSVSTSALSQGFNNSFDSPASARPAASPTEENAGPFNNELEAPDTSPTAADEDKTESSPSTDTKNKSMAIGGSAKSFLGILRDAGLMAIPIACCSLLLVMFVLERAFSLRRRRVIPKHFVRLFMTSLEEGQLKPEEALEQCEENRSPIAEVFAAAVKKWNRPSVEVEQAVLDAGERVANGLRRYLRLFNGIATISPLLGLLGTVLGMIRAFNAIAASSDAMGKPEVLAEGIGQALLTTAGGLSVAIPAFIAYMYFSSCVDRLIIEIDSLGQQVVSAIANDAWKGGRGKSRKAA